jgi:2-dehydro-3-deoxy-D-pentonate aldolase
VDLAGLYVPLLTPMAADGGLDLDPLSDHVERLLAAGVNGFVALGTTGEFADLTAAERAAVAGAVVAAAGGRVPVLVGVGAVGTAEAREHARAAADAGADGVLSLPPLYWKLGDDGLLRHFVEVAAATDLPLLLYDFPRLAATALTPALVDRVAREVPTSEGIKLSGAELRNVHGVLARVKPHRPEFSVLAGAADLLLAALLAGADGGILAVANVDPGPAVALLDAVRRGDLEDARTQHRRILDLLAIPARTSPPILALKEAAGLPPHVRTQPDRW